MTKEDTEMPFLTYRSLDRRNFIRASSAAVAGSLIPGQQARAAKPQEPETVRTRLLSGCCAYCYGKELGSGQMTMEDFIHKSVELGVNGVDMTVYWLKSTEPRYLAHLRHLAYENAMPFSGAACRASVLQATGAARAAALEDTKKWVDVTNMLGASHLRIFAGRLHGATARQGIAWSVEVMKAACDYSGERGITLGLENHTGITEEADALLEIIHGVDSPYGRINLDITNFKAGPDEEQYRQIEACIPFASHAHIRDFFEQNHHPVDLDRVWRLFAKAGYKGYMSAEYEGKEDPTVGVPRLVDEIKTLCVKYSSCMT
jgi:sugar phosphate isomerase/epimerase